LFCDQSKQNLYLDYNKERNQYNFLSIYEILDVFRDDNINNYLKKLLTKLPIIAAPKTIRYGNNGTIADIFLIQIDDYDIRDKTKLTKSLINNIKTLSVTETSERLKVALKVFDL